MKYEIRTYTVQSPFGGPDRTVIHSAEDAVRVVRAVLAGGAHQDRDHHVIVALDARHRLPGKQPTTDNVSAYLVDPIEVFHAAAAFGAVSVIVCRKSPPSDQLSVTADYLGVLVHDPVVVALA
jgi:DNA repair protein RadC